MLEGTSYIISNNNISLTVNKKGAEICSLIKDGMEYMWDADPKYWGRTAPILFPIVGSLRNKEYRYDGKQFNMNQHGFARDMEFEVVKEDKKSIRFRLTETKDTLEIYPFRFCLDIEYELSENSVIIKWIVTNNDNKDMYFSIGGHPAFMCPINKSESQTDYTIKLTQNGLPINEFECTLIGTDGLAAANIKKCEITEGMLPITKELFSDDALVLENSQVGEIALIDKNKKEYIRVEFDAPVVGIWSPPKKEAPFICIEPWYGRCDSTDFMGDLSERKWGNTLKSGEQFKEEIKFIVT